MRKLDARLKRLEQAVSTDRLTVIIRDFCTDLPRGILSVGNEPIARKAHETDEQYRERAISIAPTQHWGGKIIHEAHPLSHKKAIAA